MTLVKICGNTNERDIVAVAEFGADCAGVINYIESPRHVELEEAGKLSSAIRGTGVKIVLVTVKPTYEYIKKARDKVDFDILQIHGNPPKGDLERFVEFMGEFEIWKTEHIHSKRSVEPIIRKINERYCNLASMLLLDAYKQGKYGGTGHTFRWDLVKYFIELEKKIGIAGGLTPENVAEAIRTVRSYSPSVPYLVDVVSGVEDKATKDKRGSERRKNLEQVKKFIYNAKTA